MKKEKNLKQAAPVIVMAILGVAILIFSLIAGLSEERNIAIAFAVVSAVLGATQLAIGAVIGFKALLQERKHRQILMETLETVKNNVSIKNMIESEIKRIALSSTRIGNKKNTAPFIKELTSKILEFILRENGAVPEYAIKEAYKYVKNRATTIEEEFKNNIEKVLSEAQNAEEKQLAIFFNTVTKAENANAESQYLLGKIYQQGEGVDKNYTKAFEWYTKSAEQEYAEAEYALFCCYSQENGIGVELDPVIAGNWLLKSANNGYIEAECTLGQYFFLEQQNAEEAFPWLKKASEKGHLKAQNTLAGIYYMNNNYQDAANWFSRAAEQGDVDAQGNAGLIFKIYGDERSGYIEAVKWLSMAAEQGKKDAYAHLAEIYYNGGRGVEKNPVEAIKWLEKADKDESGKIEYNLGRIYFSGSSSTITVEVPENHVSAVEWLMKSADKEHSDAQFLLGVCLYYGKGVAKNIDRAIELFIKAASRGVHDAQFNLGKLYFYGVEIEKNVFEAIKWLEKSSKNKHSDSLLLLAKCYREANRKGDDVLMFEALNKAADLGSTDGLTELGLCYECGNGVDVCIDTAKKYYEMAATQGCLMAKDALKRLEI